MSSIQFTQLSNTASRHYDVVICSVPLVDTKIPLMAPAILKKTAEQAGMSCLAVDINVEIYNYVMSQSDKTKFTDFFLSGDAEAQPDQEIQDVLRNVAEQILSFTPEWVGLSLFSFHSQSSAKWLSRYIRTIAPNVKIVIGGAGCLPSFTGPSVFVSKMFRDNLVDYHIRGDAEISFYQLLIGNTNYPGINDAVWQQLTNEELEMLPMPDYSDYNFDLYRLKAIPVIGSRGCVRQCTFCDYIANWDKFQWRTAQNIFDEIVYQSEKYNVTNIKLQDSLINGNQKEFFKLMTLLADYNDSHPEKKIRWSSYFVFREHHARSEYEWDLISRSGAQKLAVGIENLNQHIRYAIGKKFSDEAIIFHLEQALKHNIAIGMLHVVGYINETQKDIDYIKQWLTENKRFNKIVDHRWGQGLSIFENTYLSNNKDILGIKMIGPSSNDWVSEHTHSTAKIRKKWSFELNSLSKRLGFTSTTTAADQHESLESVFLKL
jgi:radical SAM superfamily enzyme YgiQ (UPF0313 family)